MTNVDPRDFIDMYLVKVQPVVLSDTSMTRDDFDEEQHSVIFSRKNVDGDLHIEFTSEQGAERLVEKWNYNLDAIRRGKLILRAPHANDGSEVDAYLFFQARS
jgi:hypothetical protein